MVAVIAREHDGIPGIHEDQIERVRAPLDQAYTLPPAAYTSPEVYEREVERIMRRQWLPLARVDQVAAPGDYLTLDLFGQPVMVVHGNDGEIRVLSSVCLHRGAPIAEGCGRRNVFSCPYHAWAYDTTGQLVRAPLMEGVSGFEPKSMRLPQIRSEIWQGFVMANLDPEAAPFAPGIEDFTDYFDAFRLDEMSVARTLEFDSPWNWKVLVENFMEAYHHIATHSGSLEAIYHAADSEVPDNTGPFSILRMPPVADFEPPTAYRPEGLADDKALPLFATVLFPHFLLGIQSHSVAWYQVLPSAADRLLLRIHLMLPRAVLESPEADAAIDHFAELVTVVHHEDIEANDRVWEGLTAPLTEQGRLSMLEKGIWQLNQWWLDQMR